MLQEYPTTNCSKRCHVSGQEFKPGESYYSVLMPSDDDHEIVRMDISASRWNKAPDKAIGWWKCRRPPEQRVGLRPAPNSVLLDMLSELLKRPDQWDLAYLLALLLVRRRLLTEEQKVLLGDDPSANGVWNLVQPADGRQWQVPISKLSTEELSRLQASLVELLFTDE